MEVFIGKGILWLTGIIIAILSKNSLTELYHFVKSTRMNKAFVNHAVSMSTLEPICEDLALFYKVHRVALYRLHNGEFLINGMSLKKMSCMAEYHHPDLQPKIDEQQNVLTAPMADFFVSYERGEMVKCHNPESYKGTITNLPYILKLMNVRSTYSMIVKDKNGYNVGVLIMNGEFDNVKITDFTEFNFRLRQIGEILTKKR